MNNFICYKTNSKRIDLEWLLIRPPNCIPTEISISVLLKMWPVVLFTSSFWEYRINYVCNIGKSKQRPVRCTKLYCRPTADTQSGIRKGEGRFSKTKRGNNGRRSTCNYTTLSPHLPPFIQEHRIGKLLIILRNFSAETGEKSFAVVIKLFISSLPHSVLMWIYLYGSCHWQVPLL